MSEQDDGKTEFLYRSLMEPSRFLLVSLTMDAILEQTTAHGRRRKLRALTEGLDLKDIYGTTVERIKEQGGESKAGDGNSDVGLAFGAVITTR